MSAPRCTCQGGLDYKMCPRHGRAFATPEPPERCVVAFSKPMSKGQERGHYRNPKDHFGPIRCGPSDHTLCGRPLYPNGYAVPGQRFDPDAPYTCKRCAAMLAEEGRWSNPEQRCVDCGTPVSRPDVLRCRPCFRIARRGPGNPFWKAEADHEGTLHDRARRALPALGTCEYDGCEKPATDRHHIDGNPANNELTNIACLCRRHHMAVDGRLQRLAERNRAGRKP